MALTRRIFLKWSAAVTAWVGGRRAAAAPAGRQQPQVAGLGPRELLPLAEAVLPAELGAAGIQRATNEFAALIAGYRPGAETLHPYGSERLGTVAPFAPDVWVAQLTALDASARSRHGRGFAGIAAADRVTLVQEALAAAKIGNRVTQKLAAPHVALGLLTHFLDSPAATNLAYRRVIDLRQCRPLADSPRIPVPLRRASRGGAGR